MSFGFSLRRWDDAFEEDELSAVRAFVQRVDPTQSWEALLQAKPPGLSFGLWSELGHYWDSLLTRYGVVAHYEAVQLLPVHFAASDPSAPRCVNLRPDARWGWFVLDAGWVEGAWPGHKDGVYARQCQASSRKFADWMAAIGPGDVEHALAALERRRDVYELVTAPPGAAPPRRRAGQPLVPLPPCAVLVSLSPAG